jgi:hypothetical protein
MILQVQPSIAAAAAAPAATPFAAGAAGASCGPALQPLELSPATKGRIARKKAGALERRAKKAREAGDIAAAIVAEQAQAEAIVEVRSILYPHAWFCWLYWPINYALPW